jgi:hypothetical protein
MSAAPYRAFDDGECGMERTFGYMLAVLIAVAALGVHYWR